MVVELRQEAFPCIKTTTVDSLQVAVIMSSEPMRQFDIITHSRVTHVDENIEAVGGCEVTHVFI